MPKKKKFSDQKGVDVFLIKGYRKRKTSKVAYNDLFSDAKVADIFDDSKCMSIFVIQRVHSSLHCPEKAPRNC